MLYLENPLGNTEESSEALQVGGDQQAEIQGRIFPVLKIWTAENC